MRSFFQRFFSTWRGSTLQAIAIVVLPLTLLLVAISFGSYFIHQNAMRSMVGERDARAVRAAATIIDSEIQRRMDSVRSLAVLTAGDDQAGLERALAGTHDMATTFDYGLAIFSPNGKPLASSGNGAFWNAIPRQVDGPNVATLMMDGKQVVLISYAAPDGGNVAMGAFTPDELLRSALEDSFPENGNEAVYVFDPSFRILYKSGVGTLESDPVHHPGIAEALSGKSGATYVRTPTDEHVVAYSPVPLVDWAVVTEESWQAVSTPTLQTSQITPMILVPALMLAVLALWFGAEQIVNPLRSLETKAGKLASGDFQEIEKPVQGIMEIRRLQNELVHMARQVQAAQQGLHSYIGAITHGQEEERRRLARDLHDDTIQSLIALKQRAQLTRRALPQETSLPSLAELEALTEQTIENLRRTIRALRPIYLEDFGLAAALDILAKETSQASGLMVEFQKIGDERRLAPDVELALYRMAQEALNNTVHHSSAKQATIWIEFTEDSVCIRVADDGVGFISPSNPAEFVPGGHFGLVGLYERAQLIGADLTIKSAPGKGTQVTIEIRDDSTSGTP